MEIYYTLSEKWFLDSNLLMCWEGLSMLSEISILLDQIKCMLNTLLIVKKSFFTPREKDIFHISDNFCI